jgi:hypothetical protein
MSIKVIKLALELVGYLGYLNSDEQNAAYDVLRAAVEAHEKRGSEVIVNKQVLDDLLRVIKFEAAGIDVCNPPTQTAVVQPAPVQFKCTVVDDQHPNGVPLEQWGTPPAQPAFVALLVDEARMALFEAINKRDEYGLAALTDDKLILQRLRENGFWIGRLNTPRAAQSCPTCEALARSVMMDQTGRDA